MLNVCLEESDSKNKRNLFAVNAFEFSWFNGTYVSGRQLRPHSTTTIIIKSTSSVRFLLVLIPLGFVLLIVPTAPSYHPYVEPWRYKRPHYSFISKARFKPFSFNALDQHLKLPTRFVKICCVIREYVNWYTPTCNKSWQA